MEDRPSAFIDRPRLGGQANGHLNRLIFGAKDLCQIKGYGTPDRDLTSYRTKPTWRYPMSNPVTAAKEIVEAYLERSMVPDPIGAAAYVADDFEVIFTGGRQFTGPADTTAFNAKRYKWVKKRFLRTDAAYDAETGSVYVYNTGFLYGEWPDGTPFETNRYMDMFVVRDGKITSTNVWNDSAEILLHRAGLAEAPL